MQNNILASAAYGQNLDNMELSSALSGNKSPSRTGGHCASGSDLENRSTADAIQTDGIVVRSAQLCRSVEIPVGALNQPAELGPRTVRAVRLGAEVVKSGESAIRFHFEDRAITMSPARVVP